MANEALRLLAALHTFDGRHDLRCQVDRQGFPRSGVHYAVRISGAKAIGGLALQYRPIGPHTEQEVGQERMQHTYRSLRMGERRSVLRLQPFEVGAQLLIRLFTLGEFRRGLLEFGNVAQKAEHGLIIVRDNAHGQRLAALPQEREFLQFPACQRRFRGCDERRYVIALEDLLQMLAGEHVRVRCAFRTGRRLQVPDDARPRDANEPVSRHPPQGIRRTALFVQLLARPRQRGMVTQYAQRLIGGVRCYITLQDQTAVGGSVVEPFGLARRQYERDRLPNRLGLVRRQDRLNLLAQEFARRGRGAKVGGRFPIHDDAVLAHADQQAVSSIAQGAVTGLEIAQGEFRAACGLLTCYASRRGGSCRLRPRLSCRYL